MILPPTPFAYDVVPLSKLDVASDLQGVCEDRRIVTQIQSSYMHSSSRISRQFYLS